MPNPIDKSSLLTLSERYDIYGSTFLELQPDEYTKYFALTKKEKDLLETFANNQEAMFFLLSLAFFKAKKCFIDFKYHAIKKEWRYLIGEHFRGQYVKKSFPPKYVQSRIKSQILGLLGYQRFTVQIKNKICDELSAKASMYPRQRQLAKELLNLFVRNKVAIPGYTTLQEIVSKVWQKENTRLIKAYKRYTNKAQRSEIMSLLEKTDNLHHIISIRQDMKTFKTHDLWEEVDKFDVLSPIYKIAQEVVPMLSLPNTTVEYYANLINYYNGPKLKQLKPDQVGLYLLCYVYTRYKKLNDNLIEAFKKRTSDYQKKANKFAKEESAKHLDLLRSANRRVSNLLIDIKNDEHPHFIMKDRIYSHIPEDQLLDIARILVDENLDQDILFWKYIDSEEDSIKLNLRSLFLKINFIATSHELLNNAVQMVKKLLETGNFSEKCEKDSTVQELEELSSTWRQLFSNKHHEYIFDGKKILFNRAEFQLYSNMIYHLSTNILTLESSAKYRRIEDETISDKKWKKEKKPILKSLEYTKLLDPISKTLRIKKKELTRLYHTVNKTIKAGENEYIIIKKDKNGNDTWRLSPLPSMADPNEGIFGNMEQKSIVDVIRFVNQKTNFLAVFEGISPKSARGASDDDLLSGVILANALRVGVGPMSEISDLNKYSLLSTEASSVRVENLMAAADIIHNKLSALPIFKRWYINSRLHGSLDGLKLGTSRKNIKARHSKKYFSDGTGVSSYNEVVNFLSITSKIIGANEYEGHYMFEMVHNQNTSEIKPKYISTDKHGVNSLNFALCDFTDLVFAPRIPKPHKEALWGFGSAKDYEGMIVRPTHFVDEALIESEWDNIQRLVASILTGETAPNILIRKLASKNYSSRTKKALVQYNHIVRSHFLLLYIHDHEFRRAIMLALNRGELYNSLYRSISIFNNGKLRGNSEIEMEIWNQCTRLIASVMHYYNAYILDKLYQQATTKKQKEFLENFSPTANAHINLLGYYQFLNKIDDKSYEQQLDSWIQSCDIKKMMVCVEKNNDNMQPTEAKNKKSVLVKPS